MTCRETPVEGAQGMAAMQRSYVEPCSEERGVLEREGEVKGALVGGG